MGGATVAVGCAASGVGVSGRMATAGAVWVAGGSSAPRPAMAQMTPPMTSASTRIAPPPIHNRGSRRGLVHLRLQLSLTGVYRPQTGVHLEAPAAGWPLAGGAPRRRGRYPGRGNNGRRGCSRGRFGCWHLWLRLRLRLRRRLRGCDRGYIRLGYWLRGLVTHGFFFCIHDGRHAQDRRGCILPRGAGRQPGQHRTLPWRHNGGCGPSPTNAG